MNQASNALTSANSALSALRRKSASGQYNDDELQIAINHAKKMVRVARKKVQNIRRESQMESDDKGTVHRKQNETGQKIVRRRKKADEKEDALQELQLLKKQMKTQGAGKIFTSKARGTEFNECRHGIFVEKMIRLLKTADLKTINATSDLMFADEQTGTITYSTTAAATTTTTSTGEGAASATVEAPVSAE